MPVLPAFVSDPLADLPRAPASDVKKLGWRGVMETVRREGAVVVTNHERPEAVILPVAEYERLQRGNEAAMAALRSEYDERLRCLDAPGTAEALRDILRKPLDLDGAVIAGQDY
ncbi:type II toxin-antitoxin system prevent-host-death family antitoxin [Xanthomonadaceae bacterium JHOS43]|nr:type II toxin-antitoxin system prevent-host-death family antitoxin [Xanthomonadaceae bacterium JHOS43]